MFSQIANITSTHNNTVFSDSSEAPRTCTSLCENVINGCYFIMARLFAEEHEAFSGKYI